MMGCNIFDDEIDDVIINEQGQVKQLKSKNQSQLSVSINDIEQVLNAANNALEENKNIIL